MKTSDWMIARLARSAGATPPRRMISPPNSTVTALMLPHFSSANMIGAAADRLHPDDVRRRFDGGSAHAAAAGLAPINPRGECHSA
jgi:hypothetical protein